MLTLSDLKITKIHQDFSKLSNYGEGEGRVVWGGRCLEVRAEKYLYPLFLSEITEGEANNNSRFLKLIALSPRYIRC